MQRIIDLLLRQVRFLLDTLACIYGSVFCRSRQRYLPPISSPLLLLSATELARQIKSGKVTSTEVVRTFINRCKEVNLHLNALIDDDFEAALEQARLVDLKVARELSGQAAPHEPSINEFPFLGVPFTAKNSISAKGKTFSAGVFSRRELKGSEDAVAIERMKGLGGAVFLGLTNIPECVMWQDTFNRVEGRTVNPYDSARIPGGSSGGEAALIAACGSVIGIGSDIGGSIRLPAHCCGIFGHKTTPRCISLEGVFPKTGHVRAGVNTLGPMCRYAVDLRPMLRILAGGSLSLPVTPLDYATLNVYTLHQIDDPFITPVDGDITRAITKLADHFTQNGSQVIKLETSGEFADLRYSFNLWTAAMADPSETLYIDHLTGGKRDQLNVPWELLKCALGLQRKYTASVLTFALSEELGLWKFHEAANKEMLSRLKASIHQLLGTRGVILCPTMPETAIKHSESLAKGTHFSYTSLWSALNVSVTVVPVGLDRNGLPIGVQVIAGPKNDNLPIQIAEEIERTFGGWVAPCPISVGHKVN